MVDRNEVIEGALKLKHNINQINDGLNYLGLDTLSQREEALIRNNRWGENLIQRIGSSGADIAKGLGTALSIGGQALLPTQRGAMYRQLAKEGITDYAKNLMQGKVNPVEDVANLFLETYNTNVKELTTNPKQAVTNIATEAWANPINPILDTLPIIPKGVGATVAKTLTESIPIARDVRRWLTPTQQERNINNILRKSTVRNIKDVNETNKTIRTIANDKNLAQAINNLETGNWQGNTELTNKLKNFSDKIGEALVREGVEEAQLKNTAINQYIQRLLSNDNSNILVGNIAKARGDSSKANLKAINLNSKEQLDNLVKQGEKLYGEGLIRPITQRGLNRNALEGSGLLNTEKGIFAERLAGVATPEQIAKNFESGYSKLISDINNARASREGIQDLTDVIGLKATLNDIRNLSKDQTVISPKEYSSLLSDLFKNNKQGEAGKLLSNYIERGVQPESLAKYADDLYIVNKDDLRAIKNKFSKSPEQVSSLLRGLSPIVSSWKSTVLSRPSYPVTNRISNLISGITAGVDYGETLRLAASGKLDNKIPEYLLSSTSFHGLAPQIMETGLWDSAKTGFRRAQERFSKLKDDNLDTVEKGINFLEGLNELQQIVTRPVFQAESTFEYLDRVSAYVTAAQREARRTGKSIDNVLDNATKDINLQNKLLDTVDNILGNYVDRNYFVGPAFQSFIDTTIPFNKVITASADVLRNRIAENPIRLNLTTRIPAREANEVSQLYDLTYNQPQDNDVRGGVTVANTYSTLYPSVKEYNPYHPYSPIFEVLNSISGRKTPFQEEGITGVTNELIGGSPIIDLVNAIQGRDRYGNTPLGNNSYSVNGNVVTLDNNGNKKSGGSDVIGSMSSFIGRNLLPIATLSNEAILPLAATILGKNFYRPTNRTIFGQIGENQSIVPYLIEGRTYERPFNEYGTFVPRQIGIRQRNVYRERPKTNIPTQRDINSALRQRLRRNILKNRNY